MLSLVVSLMSELLVGLGTVVKQEEALGLAEELKKDKEGGEEEAEGKGKTENPYINPVFGALADRIRQNRASSSSGEDPPTTYDIAAADVSSSAEGQFTPSEDIVTQVMDMGFSREHVLEGLNVVRSNSLDMAMDYVLNHPPQKKKDEEENEEKEKEKEEEKEEDMKIEEEEEEKEEPKPKPKIIDEKVTRYKEQLKMVNFYKNFTSEFKTCLQTFENAASKICLDLVESGSAGVGEQGVVCRVDNGFGTGDGASEGVVFVVSKMLVDLSKRSGEKLR